MPFWPVLFSLHPNKDTRQLAAEQIRSQSENVGDAAAAAAAVTAALIWIFANPVSLLRYQTLVLYRLHARLC